MLRVCSADANPPASVSAVGSTLAHSATPLWTPSTLRWDTARPKLHTDTHTHIHTTQEGADGVARVRATGEE